MSVPLSEFVGLTPDIERVFITENKINGLAFPTMRKSLVIFGLGGGIDLLRDVDWLRSKEIWYWGDIDTHGFVLLARLRKYFSHTRSLLMDNATFQRFKIFWVQEPAPHQNSYDLNLLRPQEREVLASLHVDGEEGAFRLEQERISLSYLRESLSSICPSDPHPP